MPQEQKEEDTTLPTTMAFPLASVAAAVGAVPAPHLAHRGKSALCFISTYPPPDTARSQPHYCWAVVGVQEPAGLH